MSVKQKYLLAQRQVYLSLILLSSPFPPFGVEASLGLIPSPTTNGKAHNQGR